MPLILALESSCDETGAAVVADGVDVYSNIIASQHDLHAEYGGVVPEIASRAHVERILPVIRAALAGAHISLKDVDAVAVGHRPGLIGSLLVGVSGAKALAWSLEKPLIGVDHIHAHLYAPLLRRAGLPVPSRSLASPPQDARRGMHPTQDSGRHGDSPMAGLGIQDSFFPALGLAVSGGHTALYRLDSPLAVRRVGATIDDAVGEAFDKCAAMLGLGHPGGPAIDRLARDGDDRAHDFPISRLAPGSLDFSYSGLKTAVLYTITGGPAHLAPPPPGAGHRLTAPVWQRDHTALSAREKADIAASFQRAAVGALLLKLRRAYDAFGDEPPRAVLIGGGVSANTRLRAELGAFGMEKAVPVKLPAMEFCLDNAAMIAGLAHHRLAAGERDGLTLTAMPTTKN